MRFLLKRSNSTSDIPVTVTYGNEGSLSFSKLMSGGKSCMNISAIYAAIEIISNTIALIPINVKRINADGKKEIDRKHPVMLAIDGCLISKFTLMKNLIRDLYFYGNAYVYIKRSSGIVTNIVYLQHGRVSTVYDERNLNLYYLVPDLTSKRILPRDMIHLIKNNTDGVHGISILDYAKLSIELADVTDAAASNYWSSGAMASGVLSVQGPVSDKLKVELLNNWRRTYGSDSGNNGGVVVLPGNMTYQAIGNNANDSLMLDARLFNLQEICRYFNISPVLLGDLSHSSYSTIEASNLLFLTLTLSPIISLVECEFNRKLLLPEEKDTYIIDLDESFLLKSDKSSTSSYYTSLVNSGLLSINEARIQLGYGPVEDGDSLHIAYSNAESSKISGKDNNTDINNKVDKNLTKTDE